MALRTTETAIRAISEIDASITNLAPFMTAANAIVTAQCEGIDDYPDTAALVEAWLAAHIIAVRDPKTASESVAGIGATYQGQTGLGLSGTLYGQTAMILDVTGGLARWDAGIKEGRAKRTAGIVYLGTD